MTFWPDSSSFCFVANKTRIMEQRINIKFLAKYGENADKTYEMLKKVYGDDCLTRRTVYHWHKKFLKGRESVEDAARSGKPRSARTPAIIEEVREILAEDPNATARMIAEVIGISSATVHQILHKDLGKEKPAPAETASNE